MIRIHPHPSAAPSGYGSALSWRTTAPRRTVVWQCMAAMAGRVGALPPPRLDDARFKPSVDVAVIGAAQWTRPAAHRSASFHFGAPRHGIARRLVLFPPRDWRADKPIICERGRDGPLTWHHAFGGPGYALNPDGVGFDGQQLPQIEDPAHLMTSPRDRPPPAGFWPIPMHWPVRQSKLGTYDAKWLQERFPYFPADFDFGYFQVAPREQQLDEVRGDEPYRIEGMHREHPVVEGHLPGIVTRAFAQRTAEAGGGFFEVRMKLDTVLFDMTERVMHLTWRGVFKVADERALDVAEVFVMQEQRDTEPCSLQTARDQYLATSALGRAVEVPGRGAVANENDERSRDPHAARVAAALEAAGVPTTRATAGGVAPEVREEAPRVCDPAVRPRAEAALATPGALDGVVLADGELSGLSFARRSLVGANLKGSALRLCDLRGADLRGAQLAGADFTGAQLDGAQLDMADLDGAVLEDASLVGASLSHANLRNVRAARARFDGVSGIRPRFADAQLQSTSFIDSRLNGPDFWSAVLDDADFTRARVPAIRLYEARGTKVSFHGADLTGARADGAVLSNCRFTEANAGGSVWDGSRLEECDFSFAELAKAGLCDVMAVGSAFAGANLVRARLRNALLVGSDLRRADLREAMLEGADFGRADLTGASLYAAETWLAKFDGARLDGADLTNTKLAHPGLKESRR